MSMRGAVEMSNNELQPYLFALSFVDLQNSTEAYRSGKDIHTFVQNCTQESRKVADRAADELYNSIREGDGRREAFVISTASELSSSLPIVHN